MDPDTFTYVAIAMAAAVVIVIAGTFLLLGKAKEGMRKSLSRRQRKRPAGKDVCGICLGPVSREDVIAECGCGQIFHDVCAKPTGACPYCDSAYNEFKIESPDFVKCPSCGSDVVGNVCACGALVNRGGTFVCGCGNALDASDPVCGKCGAKYELRLGRGKE
jgi:DNA-directed RNA polymerase subunit RPC12/RpoP